MRAINRILLAFSFLLSLFCTWGQTKVDFTRTEDVIYGRKFGTALTLDVFQPQPANGVGIVLMVSGGWYSSHDSISADYFRPLLNRGYTVFAVVHGSQPKFVISEIVPDIHLSLIHISEPTRRTPISYAVFCLKKK